MLEIDKLTGFYQKMLIFNAEQIFKMYTILVNKI